MGWLDEKLSEQFYAWEIRGRGIRVFDEPVYPEPPFLPFESHYLQPFDPSDDGRRHTPLSALSERVNKWLRRDTRAAGQEPVLAEEPSPVPLSRESLTEILIASPPDLDHSREAFAHCLTHFAECREPLALEFLGLPHEVCMQIAAHPDDAPHVRTQFQAHFPEASFRLREGSLAEAWLEEDDGYAAIVEFGLAKEFIVPLMTGRCDPFIGLVASLSEMKQGELGLFQVLFTSVQNPWADSVLTAVTDAQGKSFFVNRPELAKQAQEKISSPLFSAVVRLAAKSPDFDRAWNIVRGAASSLHGLSSPQGNEFIPLSNKDYPYLDHQLDVIFRQSRRCGMILNQDELLALVHLPSDAVRSPKLLRDTAKTKATPEIVRHNDGILLGENEHVGEIQRVNLDSEQRSRHMHVIGASGTGKSTLLFSMIRQDIENGEGVAVLDPHGDLVDNILAIVPENRIGDVVLVDPADKDFPIGFNILSAHSELEKNLLASDLVSVFERLSTSWGDQMSSVLRNAVLAFLESDRTGTLHDLRRFLLESEFRKRWLLSVTDPHVVYYWQKAFPQLTGNKSIGPLLTRLDTFLGSKLVRNMVSQPTNRLDFQAMMDDGKIVLAKLPQGIIGTANAYLLGSLFVSKFQQAAMARQQMSQEDRKYFWLYIDEFHCFITPSMAEILTGARKYRLGLILAHQDLSQLQRDNQVSSAVISNAYTRVCFRVGDHDAKALAGNFSFFDARDLQNLGTGRAVCRVEKSDYDFNLSVSLPERPASATAAQLKQKITDSSRKLYGTSRADVEATILSTVSTAEEVAPSTKKQPIAEEVTPAPKDDSALLSSVPSDQAVKKEEPTSKSTAAPDPVKFAPSDLGKGGAEHKLIQQRIKAAAEGLGWRAILEKPILDKQGSVDLVLERSKDSIACEISVTTTVDHEIGNVAKCIKAGFLHVAIICSVSERLKRIETGVKAALGIEAKMVGFYSPDTFIKWLAKIAPPSPSSPPEPKISHGYKITKSAPLLTPEEQKEREETSIRAIADVMRKKKQR